MEEIGAEPPAVVAVVTEPRFAQTYRDFLERRRLLDGRQRVRRLRDDAVALPLLAGAGAAPEQLLRELRERVAPGSSCSLQRLPSPSPSPSPSAEARGCSPAARLARELRLLLRERGLPWSLELQADLPRTWRRHGDLLLLGDRCFRAEPWRSLGSELWVAVASALGARRVARRGPVQPDGARTPSVTLLLGEHGWVEHRDNGIRYAFDVTRCMFSCGNVAEKLRVASLACAGEVVVDLYAGIGYFTLPFLVHAGAAFVHACEWNPHAALALRRNLQLNGVAHRCRVHLGDNRELPLRDAADRVNLGLLPSSEAGWPVACRVLRKDAGGILHIHQNVESFSGKSPQKGVPEDEPGAPPGDPLPAAARPEWRSWAASAGARIAALLEQVHGKQWSTRVLRVHPVKSYAPHVDHLVLDLECRPLL